jgi:hypothetical protein
MSSCPARAAIHRSESQSNSANNPNQKSDSTKARSKKQEARAKHPRQQRSHECHLTQAPLNSNSTTLTHYHRR